MAQICMNCGTSACTIASLTQQLATKEQQLADAKARVAHLEKACCKQNNDISQTLGKALGYPWFKDDQKTFPGATEENGVCVGEHVAETLADEAVRMLADARLLARACRNYFWYDEAKKSIAIYVNCKTIEDHPCELDPSGFPILTDELRAALQKAIGET
jgi:hypothetical protein